MQTHTRWTVLRRLAISCLVILCALPVLARTRPRYGGTLRVEVEGDPWQRPGGLARRLAPLFDEYWADWLPVYAFAIEHRDGVILVDSGSNDYKIIAVATEDPEFNSYREAAEMPTHRMVMLRRFFQDYKQLEGKAVEVDEIRPAAEAYPIITDALSRYSEQRRKGFIGKA